MSAINTGGPAFPFSGEPGVEPGCSGMTLRDYFAAHAPTPAETLVLSDHCAYRYRYADAMLAAREKGGA